MTMNEWINDRCRRLFTIGDTAQSIAFGAAIGIFLGFTPLIGLRLVLAFALAVLCRVNKIAALVGAGLHELALPLWPAMFLLEYNIGYWLIHSPHHFPPRPNVEQLHPDFWLNWETLSKVGEPTLLGSVILGAPTAGLFYFLTKRAVLRTQKGRARPRALPSATPPPHELLDSSVHS